MLLESLIGKMIASLFSISFQFFDTTINLGDLSGSIESLMSLGFSNTGSYGTLWGMGSTLYNILQPVSLSLLTLFFLMDIFTLMRDVNQITWERVVMKAIKGIAVYAVILNLRMLLSSITGIVQNVYNSRTMIGASGSVANITLSDAIQSAFDQLSLMEEIVGMVVMFFLFAAYIGTAIAAVVSVFQRFVRLIFLYGISPIPVCLLSFSATSQAGKRFFQVFIATLFEAVLIYILLQMYKLGLSGLSSAITSGGGVISISGIPEIVGFGLSVSVYNALLTGGISLCSSMAREAVGATAF